MNEKVEHFVEQAAMELRSFIEHHNIDPDSIQVVDMTVNVREVHSVETILVSVSLDPPNTEEEQST